MGDHQINCLKDTLRREVSIPRDPLGDKLCTLDWDANALLSIDQKDFSSSLSSSPSSTLAGRTGSDDDNIIGFDHESTQVPS